MRKGANIKVVYDVPIAMRDGTVLYANLYRPDDDQQYPAILDRTPYQKDMPNPLCGYIRAHELAGQGYNVVIQDVRGTGCSEGVNDPVGYQDEDGYDSVEAVAAMPWCDGNVGMVGESYHGFTQLAASRARPPHLRAICPFQTSWTKFPALYSFGVPGPLHHKELLENIDNPEYLKIVGRAEGFEQVEVPCLNLTGWHDFLRDMTIYNYTQFRTRGGSPICREGSKLIVGPWLHGDRLSGDFDGLHFGPEGSGDGADITGRLIDWFDYWIKGKSSTYITGAPVKLFVMGPNIWRDEQEWPLARTQYREYYLHSDGRANSLFGDGTLSTMVPGEERADHYLYDPANPVPSHIDDPLTFMVQDQRPNQQRDDVLVYTTVPFAEDTELTGPITAEIFAASSAVDTDFVCKVSDVHPDGRALNLAMKLIRARYRNGCIAELLEPEKAYEYHFDIGNISMVLPKGHCIRLEITSSLTPDAEPNPNTGGRPGEIGGQTRLAVQTILHNSDHPSRLVLPVIPK